MKNDSVRDNFRIFFNNHYQELCSVAYNYLKDESESKDVVQEVFIKIWNNRTDLVDDPKAIHYLVTAVKNNCISLLRKQIHHLSVNEDSVVNKMPVESINEQEEEEEFDIHKFVEHALNELPPKCAIVFKMSRFESMTYSQIAEKLDISVKTVENQMGKAIKIMRDYIKTNPLPLSILLLVIDFLFKIK